MVVIVPFLFNCVCVCVVMFVCLSLITCVDLQYLNIIIIVTQMLSYSVLYKSIIMPITKGLHKYID